MYTLEFTIPQTPDSPNKLLGAHWIMRKKHADKWRRLVGTAVGANVPEEPLKRAKLTLTRYSIKKMDHDNALSSFKPVTDALVACGVLSDDGPDVLDWPVVIQAKAPLRQKGICVRVEEVE